MSGPSTDIMKVRSYFVSLSFPNTSVKARNYLDFIISFMFY